MERYALYFAAAPDSPWWQAGCSWLGRDAAAMQTLQQPAIPAVAPELQQALTRNARRYGFHATLKAPFHLAPGRTLDACSHSTAGALQRAATSHFAIADALRIDGVALFCENAPGADFQLLQRYRFGC